MRRAPHQGILLRTRLESTGPAGARNRGLGVRLGRGGGRVMTRLPRLPGRSVSSGIHYAGCPLGAVTK